MSKQWSQVVLSIFFLKVKPKVIYDDLGAPKVQYVPEAIVGLVVVGYLLCASCQDYMNSRVLPSAFNPLGSTQEFQSLLNRNRYLKKKFVDL